MSGYRGDGYGVHGDHGDDDYRWGENERSAPRGAEHGNLMGHAEERVRGWLENGDDPRSERPLAEDPRAVRAADQWRDRYGREGYEGSWGLHDESYREVRQRHIDELDRDYDEWCRERETQFHSTFEDWRSRRAGDAPAPYGLEPQAVGDLMQDESSGPASTPSAAERQGSSRRRRTSSADRTA